MTNRYLEGEFAPIDREYTLTDLDVTGAIPRTQSIQESKPPRRASASGDRGSSDGTGIPASKSPTPAGSTAICAPSRAARASGSSMRAKNSSGDAAHVQSGCTIATRTL